jgi:hypothetical protein
VKVSHTRFIGKQAMAIVSISVLLFGCSAKSQLATSSASIPSLTHELTDGYVLPLARGQRLLYVSSYSKNVILAYPLAGTNPAPVEAITFGISEPEMLWTTSNGDLYVANSGNNSVTAYHAGSTAPFLTLTTGVPEGPAAVAVDSLGTIYVDGHQTVYSSGCDCGGQIAEFQKGSTSPVLTIGPQPGPFGMALDKNNNLYVTDLYGAHKRWVYVYPPWSTVPAPNRYKNAPGPLQSIAFDGRGHLLLANSAAIAQFDPPKDTVVGTLSLGTGVDQVAWASGQLYVAEYNNNRVSVYGRSSGGWVLKRSYTQDIVTPIGVAIGSVPAP